jgi:hypothetical protein
MASMTEVRKQYPQYNDLSDGELMFGLYKNFYSDMPVMGFTKTLMSDFGLNMDEVKKFNDLAKQSGAQIGFAQPEPSVGGKLAGAARGLLQGITLGGGEEVVAAGTAAGRKLLRSDERPIGDIYQQELGRERSRIQQFREESPALAYGSEIVGGVAIPLAGAKTVGQAALLGGGTGATAGYLGSEGGVQERLTGAAAGGVLGSLLGAGAQAGADALGASFQNYMTRRAARAVAEGADSVQSLKDEAGKAYAAARQSGVSIDKQAFDTLIDDIIGQVSGAPRRPIREKLTPKSADVIEAMKEFSARSVGLDDLEYFRQLAQTPAGMVTDKAEQRAASLIINGIDDFVDNLDITKVATNPQAAQKAAADLSKARELWSRMRRTERIENIINVAREGGYAGGFESGLKTQIGTILRNPKQRRGFSKEELNLLSQIQQGTPVGRILAGVSYLGFSPSGGRTPLMGGGLLTGAVTGGLAGGPLGALLGAGVEVAGTTALRAIREMSLEDQARLYAQVIASGRAAEVTKNYPGVMRYLQAVATRGTTGGVTQLPYDVPNQ